MKIFKIVFSSLCIISLLLTFSIPYISSYMQSYYKGLLKNFPENTQSLLEKKQFWAQLGDTRVFLYFTLGIVLTFLIALFFIWLKKR